MTYKLFSVANVAIQGNKNFSKPRRKTPKIGPRLPQNGDREVYSAEHWPGFYISAFYKYFITLWRQRASSLFNLFVFVFTFASYKEAVYNEYIFCRNGMKPIINS